MATKLQVYNTALRYCKSRSVTLTENRESRRLLDAVWASGGVQHCLEEALWKFATRSMKLDYDTAVTPEFGFKRAFTKPTDWVKTVAMCTDEYYQQPLDYHHEAGYWYADFDEIYVRYVSNGENYGMNLGEWPSNFVNYVAAHFAKEIVGKLTKDRDTILEVREIFKENKYSAKNNDAWNQAPGTIAEGSWTRSRRQGGRSSWDRGSRTNLIG